MHIGERIRDARKSRGLMSKDVAERAGIDPTTLSRIENGKQQPTAQILARIAVAIGVDPVELWRTSSQAVEGLSEFELAVLRMLRSYTAEQQRDFLAKLMLLETGTFAPEGFLAPDDALTLVGRG